MAYLKSRYHHLLNIEFVFRIEEDSILEYREEEIRENAHKKLWTHVSLNIFIHEGLIVLLLLPEFS